MLNIVFLDSFDHYSFADITKKGYSAVNGEGAISAVGRNGTSALTLPGSGRTAQITFADTNIVILGVAVFAGAALNGGGFLQLYDTATLHVDLRATSTGELEITRNGTRLAITSGLGLLTSTWYYIEMRVKIGDSDGTYDVRVNGVTALTGTAADTRNGGNPSVNTLRFGDLQNYAPGSPARFDDLYIASGGADNNFLGDVRMVALFPQGAGNYSQWTPSAGAGWQCVDEAAMNSDTDYVSSATPGQRNSYDFGAVGLTGSVKCVQQVTTCRKDDAGTRTIRQFARSGGADYDGSVAAVSDSYVMQRRVMPVNPATSADWTTAAVDGTEFGCKMES